MAVAGEDPEVAVLPSFNAAHHYMGFIDSDDKDIEVVTVAPEDAEWLVKTNLPHRFQSAREAVKTLLDVTIARHAARRSTVRRMRAASARGVAS
ncbi:MAG TPA: hypothetical protein VF693_09325 [Allosphingosinicella sp.]|jgi:hypothetical protein